MIDSGREPYADLAVWGPHGTRLLKKTALSGLNLMRDGTFATVELFGPPNIDQWSACYDVLSTGCLMLGAVRRPHLAAYGRWIRKLAAIYGPIVWHLLYQTDVRCRQELMQAVFQELLAIHTAAVMAKTHTDFDPLMPWDSVWKRVLEMKDWWVDEFERPAGLIKNKVMGISEVIGGDVMIATNNQYSPAPHVVQTPGQQKPSHVKRNGRKKGKGNKPSGSNGSPSNTAAASTLFCIICKATDHNMKQCRQYDPNHGKGGKGKGGKPKGGKDKGKGKW
jgi:hypothetical protein